ncbi:MAG TPA: PfkB family carbohydrate kinase [Chthoniobacterales bacterium]|nr:PfkB family carbohydrate kinase [Chthoniobacterales bacterium]
MFSHKIIPFESAPALFERLRSEGHKIVQCHGTFDLVHPGHIYHLEEARELGELLVTTVTAENYVNKGPGRPYFNDAVRAKSLAALGCVDYVVIIPFPTAVEAITCVKPDIYCKGEEYQSSDADVTGNINDDIATVKNYGGEIRYIGSVVFSSSKLINEHFDHIPHSVKEYCHSLATHCTPNEFRAAIDSFSGLKVLVIGDIIFDRYSYLRIQGLTSKNRILSGRFLHEETQAGGALAIQRHIAQFTDQVDLLGLLGTEPWVDDLMRSYLPEPHDHCLRDETFTTIIKQRFVEPTGEGKELSKLFSVNYIEPNPPSSSLIECVIEKLRDRIHHYDLIVVADFGHGTMAKAVRRLVEKEAPFMALNCQTNSNNHGFNIISCQYTRADCFSLDEQELLLSCAQRHIDFIGELKKLKKKLHARYAWLTRGAIETIGIKTDQPSSIINPFENRVIDTIGAGDAFFSVASLAACRNLSAPLSTFIGQLAGAQAVRIVGNSEPISKTALLKAGMALLNF